MSRQAEQSIFTIRPDDALTARWMLAAFWVAILLGAALRLAALGRIPAGVLPDEASTGVEALALFQTGMDRWGNHWPIWFPAWGSGMNMLYTYIAVPVVGLFGLHVVPLRAIGAVFGVMTLPVAYFTARLYFGRGAALITLWLLALLPWHVMSSRFTLDSNLVPFFFTLGLFTIGTALNADKRWPLAAFIPWAISVYAYPVSMLPILASSLALLIVFWEQIRPRAGLWIGGIALAILIDTPFLLFLVKNQFHLDHLLFEEHLPFSIPLLAATRLSQINQSAYNTVFDNLTFILSGFRDGQVQHQSVYFPPLSAPMPYLMLIGTIPLGWDSIRTRRPHVILIVVLSAVLPICLLPLNVTRMNWFYIPAMMVVANLVNLTIDRSSPSAIKLRRLWLGGTAAYLAVFLLMFYPYYFIRYNDEIQTEDVNLGNGFRVGLETALRGADALATSGEPVLAEVGTVHPYLYPLFYGLSDIRQFQQTRQMRIENGVYRVSSFDRFYFERAALPADRGFVFVTRSNHLPCTAPEIQTAGPLWTVGRCKPSS